MIPYFVLAVTFIVFILASIEDIKKREVYDYLNFGFIFFILSIGIFDSLIQESLIPITYVTLGVILGFFFGFVLYYIGMWGGGDAKFLIGFSGATYYFLHYLDFGSAYQIFSNIIFLLQDAIFVNFSLYFYFVLFFLNFLLLLLTLKKVLIDKNGASFILTILFLLFLITLYYDKVNYFSLLFSFVIFLFLFFLDERVFNNLTLSFNKKVKNLKEGDYLAEDLIYRDHILVSSGEKLNGLKNDDINFIKKYLSKESKVKTSFHIPVFPLIIFNLIFIISNEILNRGDLVEEILFFNLVFLFFSFIFGGIVSILMIVYSLLANRDKVHVEFSIYEKLSLLILLASIPFIFDFLISILFLSLVFLYLIYKFSKPVEKFALVGKKKIEDLVLGDWIVQDVEVDGKKYFSESDFRLGIDEVQLKKLKELKEKNKLDWVYVKDGIAFLPPLFLSFLLILVLF